jgi:transcriptional regulator with XRE-family HTH domain
MDKNEDSPKNFRATLLNANLLNNYNILFKSTGLSQHELAKVSNIAESTLHGIRTGAYSNPRMHSLHSIASFFNINVSQLLGEIPLTFNEKIIPILQWQDIDVKNNTINSNNNTRFISCYAYSGNFLFALNVNDKQIKNSDLIIVEETDKTNNQDLIILSIAESEPIIKKLIKEGKDMYLESITSNLPIQKFDKEATKIFGIIREVRKTL